MVLFWVPECYPDDFVSIFSFKSLKAAETEAQRHDIEIKDVKLEKGHMKFWFNVDNNKAETWLKCLDFTADKELPSVKWITESKLNVILR